MNRFLFPSTLAMFLVGLMVRESFFVACVSAEETPLPRVIYAGGSEVAVLELGGKEKGAGRKVWSWSGSVENGVPKDQFQLFRNLDECKPIDGGKQILICASNSGCGLIDFETGKLVWSAAATNAHSLEMLPGNRIVVASSLGGNRLLIFDPKGPSPEKPIWNTPLHSAHGLYWDEKGQSLWALGHDELHQYTLKDWKTAKPSLELKSTYHLPEENGHDLRAVPNSADLVITTKKAVLLFDRQSGKFRPHPTMALREKVKAIDIHPGSGRIVFTLWDSKIRFQKPGEVVSIVGNPAYKVRWFP